MKTLRAANDGAKTADFLDQVKKLIALETTESNPAALTAAIELIADIIKRQPGLTIERFECNGKPSLLAYVGSSRPSHFKILLNGHVDVVSANPEQFKLHQADGRLYGRGTLDMKLAALTMAEVFTKLAPTLSYPVGLQIVADEEVGGHDGTKYQYDQGIGSDFVIVGEPTNLDFNIASRGFCRLRLSVTGKAAHSGYLWRGQNAILRLTAVIDQILQVYPVPEAEVWQTTVNVARISSSASSINQVPVAATADLDIRYVAADENFQSRGQVETFLESIDAGLEIEWLSDLEPAHQGNQQNPLLKQLAAAAKEVTGAAPAFIRRYGAADTRFYGEAAVAFGPTGEDLHGDAEYVTLASLRDYETILAKFLRSVS